MFIVQFLQDKARGPNNNRSPLHTLLRSSCLLPLSPRKGRTVDLKTLTLIEEPASTVAVAGNGNAEPNADELDNAEEEFEKLLKESESVGRVE